MSDGKNMPVKCALRPAIEASVAAYMQSEIARHPKWEHSFRCTWDAATRTITNATHLFVGTRDAVCLLGSDFAPGTMAIHTHPTGSLEMSAEDRKVVLQLAPFHVGFGITDNLCHELLVVREPRVSRQDANPWRLWTIGRLAFGVKRRAS